MSSASGGVEDRYAFRTDRARIAIALKGAHWRVGDSGDLTFHDWLDGCGSCEPKADERARDRSVAAFAAERSARAGGRAIRLQRERSRGRRGVCAGTGVPKSAARGRFAPTGSATRSRGAVSTSTRAEARTSTSWVLQTGKGIFLGHL